VAEWTIEPLGPAHERDRFSSGRASLDDFLRSLVTQYERRRLGRTYVAVPLAARSVVGYYTLASGAVSFASVPAHLGRKLPRHPVPVVLLARLAVDEKEQGKGLGQLLLVDAMRRCLALGDRLGVHAIEVSAIDDRAGAFYERFGFIPLTDDRRHLYLPLATAEAALGRTKRPR
jgi:GNAT superfamily N-acetyltransferase